MVHHKKLKFPYILVVILTSITTFGLWIAINAKYVKHQQFVNKYGSELFLIPNIVHYIIFNKNSLDFTTYLSIISTIKVQKPNAIYIHGNTDLSGHYWDKVKAIKTNTTIHTSYLRQPTHVYGQVLSSVYHTSDVARIEVLLRFGGIYIDTDVVFINNVDNLRHFQMVVGWPDDMYVGSQVLLASKSAPFLDKWLKAYEKYHPRDWYYNAGVVPTEILQKYPYLAHYENVSLGVQNLLGKLHSKESWNWRRFYTIHLLSRHQRTIQNASERNIQKYDTNFGRIAKWILSL